MKIAFFTEGNYQGKVNRNNVNMRTDLAWICALKADHWNINQKPDQKYDLGIVIIPKNNPQFEIRHLKLYCDKVAVMQEGPNWYWQDYPLEQQIWYFNTIQEADQMLVHNEIDKKYYEGLTGKKCKILPSLMIEDSIDGLKTTPRNDRDGVIIGGNFCSWYGGFDSYIVATYFECPIGIPSMGRKIVGEENMENLNHLPYMNWVDWIHALSKFKYGVHLMRTHAAGTFALNCAYLGIPCIGYQGLDTQMICHPSCTVELGDMESARKIAEKLRKDEEFYVYCCNEAQDGYGSNFIEPIFMEKFFNG